MNWKQKFEDAANYGLVGGTNDYTQSIDRDQAELEGKPAYKFYILQNIEMGDEEQITEKQMQEYINEW